MDFSPIKLDKKGEEASSYATHLGVLSLLSFIPSGPSQLQKKVLRPLPLPLTIASKLLFCNAKNFF